MDCLLHQYLRWRLDLLRAGIQSDVQEQLCIYFFNDTLQLYRGHKTGLNLYSAGEECFALLIA